MPKKETVIKKKEKQLNMSAETAPNYRLQSRILAQLLDHFLQSISQE